MTIGRKTLRWRYVFPAIHLSVCLIALLSSVIPGWEELARAWVLLFIVDFPVSFVPLILVWKHELAAGVWLLFVGTGWWYLIGRLVEAVFGKILGPQQGALS